MTRRLNIARWGILALAMFGVIGVAPIVHRQFTMAQLCPSVGLIPACYAVLLGYLLVGLSVFADPKLKSVMFALGWIPLFVLAMTGSGLEALGHGTCPRTTHGFPACYISLAVVSLLAVMFFVERKVDTDRKTQQV